MPQAVVAPPVSHVSFAEQHPEQLAGVHFFDEEHDTAPTTPSTNEMENAANRMKAPWGETTRDR